MKAVIWTDTIQSGFMFAGLAAVAIKVGIDDTMYCSASKCGIIQNRNRAMIKFREQKQLEECRQYGMSAGKQAESSILSKGKKICFTLFQ